MDIPDDILDDFILDEGTDFWDLSIVLHALELEAEKTIFSRSFNLNNYSVQQCEDFFRFSPEQITRLGQCLRMPDQVTTYNGTTASGMEVLCIVLRRLSYPCRFVDLAHFFDRPRLEVCFLFNNGVSHIDNLFKDRLENPNQPWLTVPKLMEYSAAVHAKGTPLDTCWGFIDGTVRSMCKPSQHQREVYNGHKKVHALKFQSVVTPNGLIANLWGPLPGRRHDAALLNQSGLLAFMEAHCNTPNGHPLCVYGDQAYPLRPHIQRPHRGVNLTAAQQAANTDMSKARQSVEWQFGRLLSLFAFLDFKKNLKLFKSPVGKLYRLGALLTNCHCCLNGNQTSMYFNVQPPALEEYLY